jgi:AcrR family transcriptional regulator
MTQSKIDRRSKRTRKSLSEALLSLMGEKRYDKITVQDIVDRANVGRSTFYAHFQDREDLLLNGVKEMFTQYLSHQNSESHSFLATLGLFQHIQENQHLYQVLAWGRGMELLYEQGQAYLDQHITEQLQSWLPKGQSSKVPLPVLSAHVAGTLMTLIRWWLDHEIPYSPAQMDSMFHQLIMPTIQAAMRSDIVSPLDS